MDIKRNFWMQRINEGWKKRNIVFLAGVRRVGKTMLGKSITGINYFDCELPRIRRLMDDPEEFLSGLKSDIIVLDEIHRLENPSELLKIIADHYKNIRVIATGSSSLLAASKFRDTLTGRKITIHITPVNYFDMKDFRNTDIRHRMLHGGMPEFFLSEKTDEALFQEWMDAYWSKDIQELFRVEKKFSFQSFVELIMMQSGGIFNASAIASKCKISHTSSLNYLKILEETFVAIIIRPFSMHKQTEVIAAPKVYGFDTGFVCYHKGISHLRDDDCGFLWEHLVLNEFQSRFSEAKINYWRDKQGHEIDFVIPRRNGEVTTVECKWKSGNFEPSNLAIFRKKYPHGKNYVISSDIDRPFSSGIKNLQVHYTGINDASFSEIFL